MVVFVGLHTQWITLFVNLDHNTRTHEWIHDTTLWNGPICVTIRQFV